METRLRSLTKAIVWNLIGLGTMALVGYLATGSWSTGGKIALVNAAIGLCAYLIYERVWTRIRWGRHV